VQLGADVTVVRRMQRAAVKTQLGGAAVDHSERGKRGITIDLKRADGVELALTLVERADALIEGLRPGVMERPGPRRLPRTQRETRLWPHGGMGPDRPVGERCGLRPQLHRAATRCCATSVSTRRRCARCATPA